MEIDSSGNPNWLFDYELMTDITSAASVAVADFQSPATIDFSWPAQTIYASSNLIAETDYTFDDSEVSKEASSRKRSRIECCNSPRSKASREKLRRDRLNERFLELSSVLDPGRPPKTEKVAILSDAQKMLIELRAETQKLKDSNEELQEKIKELKAEKNELRDEKQRLKEEKENLEQQVKNLASKPGFLSHPSAMGAAFTAQGQVAGNKMMPFIGYPSVAMWQFMQPAVVDTSQDHVLRPPVA
ncbi:PREDICTED: transcription factor ILR3-like [Nicotiana attenuata]|uniref:Transcription factor ilr3 n=1 Tax=Nicotiana attenuata TaxID=49451 RepID=A0A1J6ICU6_NICAT|nr:PREDICTED: transcription factor ILR3-like [Nicotiana attenuata]OIT02869.1 transcription factor ilr3 [Nicotiana attenuata]